MMLWNAITVERVKAVAALIQAFGFIGAALLAYTLARKLEQHKYGIRRREIMFSKFHEKRLATLESLSELQGRLLYETSELLYFGGFKEPVPHEENESREAHLERSFAPRHKDISDALLELQHALESGIVYLPEPIYLRLTKFGAAISELVRTYTSRMLKARHESADYLRFGDEARAKFKELEAERHETVKLLRSYLENNEMA